MRRYCGSAVALLLCVCAAGAANAVEVPADAVTVLTADSYWRWYASYRPPIVPLDALRKAGIEADGPMSLVGTRERVSNKHIDRWTSPPPPQGWSDPTADDLAWPRAPLPWFRDLAFNAFSSHRLCLRGKFGVTDPRSARLFLTLKYVGGVVVYVNGREVARGHMPTGAIAHGTPAEMYDEDVYVGPDGAPIPSYWPRRRVPEDARKEMEARIARRTRTLGPIAIPADLLVKGTNVLALDVRRSDYHPAALKWYTPANVRNSPWWTPMGLGEVRLQGVGAGVAPNVGRPKGLQLWAADINDRITSADYGDPNEPKQRLRIVGARNGSFCAAAVLGSDKPIGGVTVTVSALKADQRLPKSGRLRKSEVPSDAVTVLYGRMNRGGSRRPPWCSALASQPPKAASPVLPIYLRVRVPRDAAPGTYRGDLRATVGGQSLMMPLEVSVADWAAPEPRDYRTYMGIYQSPTTLALKYNVKEWSKEHWRLVDRSLALLGRLGNKMVNICVVDQTQFGNEWGMVYWVKKPGGAYDYDFSVFDRYLALAKKHFGTLDYVALHVWHSGGWETRKADQKNTVTVIDRATGKREHMQVPVFGTEESKRFWKPVLAALYERLKREGLEKAMCLGILSDGTAPPAVFTAFDAVWPGTGPARWMRGLHAVNRSARPYPLKGGGVVVLHEHCYGMGMVSPDVAKLPPIWSYRGMPGTAYFRIAPFETRVSVLGHRVLPEWALFCGKQGVGRSGFDFWPVLKDKHGHTGNIYNRYPHSSCAQRAPALYSLTWAGPEGPETTPRFEVLCQGVQAAEALIVLADAMDNHADTLGSDLKARCDRLIRDRIRFCHTRNQQEWQKVFVSMNHYGWQDLDRRLFDLAAEVAEKMKAD